MVVYPRFWGKRKAGNHFDFLLGGI